MLVTGTFTHWRKKMTRKLMLASLVLCPALLHAQASSSAQLQSAKTPVLESKLVQPLTPGSKDSSATSTTTTKNVRISTGVESPKLIETAQLSRYHNWQWKAAETSRTAVVSLVVDEKGQPTHVQIVDSVGEEMDQDIVDTVRRFRYQPGKLDNQPTPIAVTLKVYVQRSSL